jgi:protein disulfide-isomerase A6
VDCDDDKNKRLCGQYGVQGFPTIKVFYTKHNKDKPEQFSKIPVDYQGERRAGAIGDFAVDRMTSRVIQLTHGKTNKGATGYEDFFAQANSTMPKAILFTDKEKTAGLYKALSIDFKGRMRLAEARGSTIADVFGIVKFPTLVVVPPGKEGVVYEGSLKHEHLHTFLSQHALEATLNDEEALKMDALPPFDPTVHPSITQKDLQTNCLDKPGVCLIVFLNGPPFEDDELIKEHEASLNLLKTLKQNDHDRNGPYQFTWVDTRHSKTLAKELDLSDDRPAVVALSARKKTFRVMLGAWDIEAIERFMRETTSGQGRGLSSLSFAVRLDQVVHDEL